ncbi:MAG: succinylglutamate desuccinylase/aspartoacylase family protein [Opitutaceae bacterium]|nr:succinylglutamate desuccinylase/aspartoacylase family protein [Opitutaceae bacterium]
MQLATSNHSRPPAVRDLRALLEPLVLLGELHPALQTSFTGVFDFMGVPYSVPRVVFTGPPAAHDPIRLAIFGGLHGDEPASVLAPLAFLERLAADPARATGYELAVYPLCNPVGYSRATRENGAGVDLNREFWRGSVQPEVQALERELRVNSFHGLIALHADDTAEGIYGYTRGQVLNEALLEPALRSAGYILPRDTRGTIDGWLARDGKIEACFQGVLSAPPGQRPRPFDLIFETPAHAPIDRQVEAAVTALDTILDEYRQFIAYAANL